MDNLNEAGLSTRHEVIGYMAHLAANLPGYRGCMVRSVGVKVHDETLIHKRPNQPIQHLQNLHPDRFGDFVDGIRSNCKQWWRWRKVD